MKFKTVAGDSDRCSGILFDLKPNGDWLAVRYNDTENNIALWEFHNGIRRNMRFSDRAKPFPLDRSAWHELKLTVDGDSLKTWLDGALALEYTLGSEPQGGRKGPPNPDLFPANNPVLRPPVAGRVGLWVENGQHQLLQGLRGQSSAIGMGHYSLTPSPLITVSGTTGLF